MGRQREKQREREREKEETGKEKEKDQEIVRNRAEEFTANFWHLEKLSYDSQL